MKNVYLPQSAQVARRVQENADTTTLYLKLPRQASFRFLAGQFMMIGLPGFSECAISLSSNPKESTKNFSLTIRAVGELTKRLNALKKGETALVRGPFGNGFPAVKDKLILIGGGCGFIPLRSVYLENQRRGNKLQIFLGCRDQAALLFAQDLKKMGRTSDLNVIFEKGKGKTGMVTDIIKKKKLLADAPIFICGPEVMYKFVIKALFAAGVKAENIWMSLERRMHCGVGVCQHCALGSKYVCKDGPVFNYAEIKNHLGY